VACLLILLLYGGWFIFFLCILLWGVYISWDRRAKHVYSGLVGRSGGWARSLGGWLAGWSLSLLSLVTVFPFLWGVDGTGPLGIPGDSGGDVG